MAQTAFRDRLKTFMLFMAWVTKGLYLEASGPAMIDLKLIYNTNYESVTRSVSGRGAGGFLGAVLAAFLVDWYEKQLDVCIAIATLIAGLCITIVPSLPSIDYVWFLYFTVGCASCIVNMAGMRMALEIWKDKSSIVLQLLHMGFGVGALLGPLVCSPFLAILDTQKNSAENQRVQYHVIKESRVETAFLIIGLFTSIVAGPFFVFQMTRKRSSVMLIPKETVRESAVRKQSFLDRINPAQYANGSFRVGFCSLMLLFTYFFNLVVGEKIFGTFVRTISVDVFHLKKEDASFVNTTFWLSLTISRLLGAFIARFIHVRILLSAQVLLHVASVTALYKYALSDVTALRTLTVIEGFLVAPLYPLGVAYGYTLVKMTGFSLMVIVFAGSFGDLSFLWLAGRMYDTYGAVSVFTGASFAAWLVLGSVFGMHIVSRWSRTHEEKILIQKINVQT